MEPHVVRDAGRGAADRRGNWAPRPARRCSGRASSALAAELAGKQLEKVYAVEHELLKDYTPDGYTVGAAAADRDRRKPTLVLLPAHLPGARLSAQAGHRARTAWRSATWWRTAWTTAQLVLVRQLFQGKLNADVRFAGDAPAFRFAAGGRVPRRPGGGRLGAGGEVHAAICGRRRSAPGRCELFRESQRAVDLSAAEIIVSVGRGIKEADNIPLVQKLADALGAELAASRPDLRRRLAAHGAPGGQLRARPWRRRCTWRSGISGAIQHLVGMKGSQTIVAINKDPNAPIFEVADYGIVGDLFQVVPALMEAVKKAKS